MGNYSTLSEIEGYVSAFNRPSWQKYRVLTGLQAERARLLIESDRLRCGCKGMPGPAHDRSYMSDGIFYNGGCASGSLYYNLETDMLVGRSHCSCDSCF